MSTSISTRMNPHEIIANVLEQLRGMWRFRWWAVAMAWIISFGGWLYVYSVPDVYRASAELFVDTSSLLRPLMRGLTADQDPLSGVQLVSRTVLTRPNLKAVAYATDLTLSLTTDAEIDALVTRLQKAIRVTGGRENVFTFQYEDKNRAKASEVVSNVLDTFIENALSSQDDDSEVTEAALQGEIREHEERLREADQQLQDFKRANLGYMPNDRGDYYSRLQAAQAAAEQTAQRVRQLTLRRDEIERQLAGEEPIFGALMAPVGSSAAGIACSKDAQLADLRRQLEALSIEYTEKHPRATILEAAIARIEQECEEQREAAPETGSFEPQLAATAPLETNPVYVSLRTQLSDTEVELAGLRAELGSRQESVASLQRDVDKILEVETQLKDLSRGYDVIQTRHRELLRRWEDLQAKKRLDPVTESVRFEIVEPPFASAEPVGPNRNLMLAAVLVLALGGGGALPFGLNQVNPAFFTRRSLKRVMELPVLGSISMILTPRERTRRRLGITIWCGSVVALLIMTVIIAAAFASEAQWLQGLMRGVGL